MVRTIAAVVGVVLLASCGSGGPPKEAKQAAAVLSGDAKGAASDNPLCKLFTAAEASAYAGESLNAGTNAAMGMGCQWASGDGSKMTMVAAVPKSYADSPSAAPGFRKLSEIGSDAYVARDMGGWIAGAIGPNDFIKVTIVGAKASEANAIALLKETIKRHG